MSSENDSKRKTSKKLIRLNRITEIPQKNSPDILFAFFRIGFDHKCVLEMVCKEEVVFWFKELESYSRIDTLCALLNMCLPFELRFIGTCLEEMCIRDAKELRGLELHVNNSTELASEIAACQFGEPSDIKARRKMAMYLALIRACNRPCVNELFNTLYLWGQNDFLKTADGDALQELLLVYTMAAHHPVFSFEQRMKCGDIFIQIRFRNSERALLDEQTVQTRTSTPSNETSSSQHTQSQSHYQLSSPVEMMPNVQQPPPIANQLISSSAPIYEQGSHVSDVLSKQKLRWLYSVFLLGFFNRLGIAMLSIYLLILCSLRTCNQFIITKMLTFRHRMLARIRQHQLEQRML